jgi:hypothetical protein
MLLRREPVWLPTPTLHPKVSTAVSSTQMSSTQSPSTRTEPTQMALSAMWSPVLLLPGTLSIEKSSPGAACAELPRRETTQAELRPEPVPLRLRGGPLLRRRDEQPGSAACVKLAWAWVCWDCSAG